jgi:predicted metal-dependent hydrolase
MKDRNDYLIYFIILFVLALSYKIYAESDMFNLVCIVSDVDNNKYCVRDRKYKQKAADLLATVVHKLKSFVQYLIKKYPDNEMIKNLKINFNPKKIVETLPNSQHTAYSENKGEKMAFCLNKTKNTHSGLIDSNTLMFVALHELAHLATTDIGHTPQYWQNFKFILENAKEYKIYNPINYKKTPKQYCGMKITDNPYYDV